MDDAQVWAVVLILNACIGFGSVLYRQLENENFKVGLFDAVCNGLLIFFSWAAYSKWHAIPSLFLGLSSAAVIFIVCRLRREKTAGR